MSGTDDPRTHKVLLVVEDNAADVRLIEECLRDAHSLVEFEVVENGIEAMAFLKQQSPYEHAPRPDIVLLDLHLPCKNGREVLAEVKQDAVLKNIPVIIMTSSEADEDVSACYDLGANCYVTKQVELEEFCRALDCLAAFWLTVARLPKR